MSINKEISIERTSSNSSHTSVTSETEKLLRCSSRGVGGGGDFNYTSFDNASINLNETRNGTTTKNKCPTCQGTGKVNREEEHKLVALIPLSDRRLKPKRIWLWILGTIFACALITILITYLLVPRALTISNDAVHVKPYNITYIYDSLNTSIIGLALAYNKKFVIKNNNFYSINMINLTLEMTRINLITEPELVYNKNELIPSLSTVSIDVRVKYIMYRTDDAYTDLCMNNIIHELSTLISVTFSFSAIWNSYQESHLKSIQYLLCSNL